MNTDPDYIAFYGTLLTSEGAQSRLGVAGKLELVGQCALPGALFDLGEFPAFVEGHGQGQVHGELFKILDPEVLAVLDRYEGIIPKTRNGSLYSRRRVRLSDPDLTAWVYCYNGDVVTVPSIDCGSWSDYLKKRQQR